MDRKLKDRLDKLVKRSRLDRAQLVLQKAGYSDHRAGLLIHCAIKATLAGAPSPVTKMDHDEHFCAACA